MRPPHSTESSPPYPQEGQGERTGPSNGALPSSSITSPAATGAERNLNDVALLAMAESQRTGGSTVNSGQMSTVLLSYLKLRSDFEKMEKTQETTMALLEQLNEKMRNTSTLSPTEVEVSEKETANSTDTALQSSAHTDQRSFAVTKVEPKHLPYMKCLLTKERVVVHLLRWASILTVVSFGEHQRSLKSWVSPGVYDVVGSSADASAEASGLGAILFAVAPVDSKVRWHTASGKLASAMVRKTLINLILYAQHTLFRHGSSEKSVLKVEAPDWLLSFGNLQVMKRMVEDAITAVESTKRKASKTISAIEGSSSCPPGPSRKRRRLVEENPVHSLIVRHLRSAVLRHLSTGRTEVRVVCYYDILFIVEQMAEFESEEAARMAGFEVIFDDGDGESEKIVPSNDSLKGSIWDLPNARTVEVQEPGRKQSQTKIAEIHKYNSDKLKEVQNNFPSLRVVLKFPREVQTSASDKPRDHPDWGKANLIWHAEEHVDLHQVALSVMMEAFVVSSHQVLRSSELSIKALHILAIALKGLLRQSLNWNTPDDLLDIERKALGEVTSGKAEKNSAVVTAMLGHTGGGVSDPIRLKEQRELRMRMSWEDYKQAKKDQEEMIKEAEDGHRSSTGDLVPDPLDGEEMDDIRKWLDMTCGS